MNNPSLKYKVVVPMHHPGIIRQKWCQDNIGKSHDAWDIQFGGGYDKLIYAFAREEDLTLFL